MKNKILIATFFLVAFGIDSCTKKENIDTIIKQEITFSFVQKKVVPASSLNLKNDYLKENARYIILTIEKTNGVKVYESKKLELYNFGGSFISQSLSLEVDVSPYKLTAFLVLDANNKVIFATPLEGTARSYLVADPLPLSFTVSKNQITKVVPEVLSTELININDFGYVSFDFKLTITPIRFFTSVQDYNPSTGNWERISAIVLVKGIPGDITLFNDSIIAITDTIKIKNGYDNYHILISKGELSKDTILTNVQLKTYLNTPMIFTLRNKKEIVIDVDGNVYNTVTIGKQVWMNQNLKVTHYRNGDPISNITSSVYIPGAYGNYNDDVNMAAIYGRLYNWNAVNERRNIAPKGWHVASDEEWTTLTDFLGGETVAGIKLKEQGTDHWADPNTGATNESGFTALPAGIRSYKPYEDTFNGFGKWTYFWTSSLDARGYPIHRYIINNSINVIRDAIDNKYNLCSVRCIRD